MLSHRAARADGTAAAPDPRPLVVSAGAEMLDELLRLAAAAGVEVDVEPDLPAARAAWSRAPLVLVDDAVVAAGGTGALPRRDSGVVLVTRDVDDPLVWRHGVETGAEHVVVLPDAEPWLVRALADAGADADRARTLCVVGGSGGAGASTLAAALATTAVRGGSRALLLDLDPWGGGIDLLVGAEERSGLRWPDLSRATGRLNGQGLRNALPTVDGLPVLTWDRSGATEVGYEAARAVVDAAVAASELVVVDLPRAGGDPAGYACSRADALVLVVPAEVRAVVAARRVLATYRPFVDDVGVVVRMPSPSGLAGREVADSLGVPLLTELRSERAVAAAADRGEPPSARRRGALHDACVDLLDRSASAGR